MYVHKYMYFTFCLSSSDKRSNIELHAKSKKEINNAYVTNNLHLAFPIKVQSCAYQIASFTKRIVNS